MPTGLEGDSLDRLCHDLTQDRRLRITVIALDGKVLGDSEQVSQDMENHATRPEVAAALSNGQGSSLRYSTTVKHEMFYVAVRSPGQGTPRVLRVSVPLDSIEGTLSSLRHAILLGLLTLSGLGLLLALLFSRKLGLRVKRMGEFARQVSTANFPADPLRVHGEDELSVLEKNLNEMSHHLQDKIKDILSEKEKVESILRCMTEGVLVVDTHGRLILFNENARRMFKLSPTATLNGASLLEVSRHPEMKRLMEEVLACDCSTECFTKEIPLDEDKWFRVNAVSLRSGDGNPLGYVLVFHDVTELKRLETVRVDFVANVSHELRTPISAIKGYVETLLHNPPKSRETAQQFLEVIDRHSERLGRLVDDLLALSDLESGKAHVTAEKVEADSLLRRVLEIFQDHARKKAVSLSQEIAPDLPSICGDPDRLQQLLINLVDNALKYTPSQGRVSVKAQFGPGANGNELPMVEISVSDTGSGIPEKDIPRLTERFYRVDRARSRELGGTGLGLAIVKHIVQAHGGYLKIESQLQRGTTVRVFLPAMNPHTEFKEILFLCTANSCRSQMAEGLARTLAPKETKVLSAGIRPTRVHPLAVRVMKEIGIDISAQQSKSLDEILLDRADLVVTLCGEAADSCPTLNRRVEHLHWPIPDPALAQGDDEYVLQMFRQVRDEIRTRVRKLLF